MAARQADLRTLSRLGIHTVAPDEGFARHGTPPLPRRVQGRRAAYGLAPLCRRLRQRPFAAPAAIALPRHSGRQRSLRIARSGQRGPGQPGCRHAGRPCQGGDHPADRRREPARRCQPYRAGRGQPAGLDLFQSLEKQFRIRVDRSLLFKEPTIDALASRIASLLDAGKRAQDGDLPVILPDSAARHEPFPLMDMQQAYWVGRTGALVLGNVSCHVYLELETEDLDLPRWEACWNRLIRHHDMLRCVIMEDGRQRILPEVPPFTVTVQDATGLDAGAAEQMVLECRERMGHEVLSAKEWPLFRVAATRMPGGSIRLHISLDLLVADLHSMNLMMNGSKASTGILNGNRPPWTFRSGTMCWHWKPSGRARATGRTKNTGWSVSPPCRPRRTCPWPSRPRRWSARASSAMRRSSTGRPGRTCAKRPPRTS